MKRGWIFIVVVAVGLLLAVLLYFGRERSRKSNLKQTANVTLRKGDKGPYGCYIAYNSLAELFKGSEVKVNKKNAYTLYTESDSTSRKAFILVSKYFEAGNYDMGYLVDFAKEGNDVFISASQWNSESLLTLNLAMTGSYSEDYDGLVLGMPLDSITAQLSPPVYMAGQSYKYAGRAFPCYITGFDSAYTECLGTEDTAKLNFVRMKIGNGNIFIHTEPACFTNLFMVSDSNYRYAEQALSALNGRYSQVIWDEYYQSKHTYDYDTSESRGSMFGSLFRMPPFRNALLLLLGVLLLYALFEVKRRQRLVPILQKPKNESLEFVNTMGKLYYEKGNHLNLAHKMSTYFLEHVRTRFKLSTSVLDDAFVQKLAARSNAAEDIVNYLVLFIRSLSQKTEINGAELTIFYRRLETFYQQSK